MTENVICNKRKTCPHSKNCEHENQHQPIITSKWRCDEHNFCINLRDDAICIPFKGGLM